MINHKLIDNVITLDYFSKHWFDFENKQAHAIVDLEKDDDAVNKQYVDVVRLRIPCKRLLKTVKNEIRRLMTNAADTERSMDDPERSSCDEFEDECNIKSLVRNEIGNERKSEQK